LLARPRKYSAGSSIEYALDLFYNFKSLPVTLPFKDENEQNNPTSRFRKQRLQRNLGIPGRIVQRNR
jgi:hypothetical protein